jgi:hypothetical protein
MNFGYDMVQRVKRIEEDAATLGFKFSRSNFGHNDPGGCKITLEPKDDDALPIYSRDANIYTGGIDDVSIFLHGIRWARDYDYMMKISNEKQRERKEQDLRNRNLLNKLKQEADHEYI